MNKLLKKHYDATCKRGKITPETSSFEFMTKLIEEVNEVQIEFSNSTETPEFASEVIDVMATCANWLQFLGYDVKELFKANINKQLTRND